ncbi:phosphate-starvation-inducible PsiE family protein [Motiliproteus sediminis]|uniref:phosphate-starvation-inducible PsiE family protein n=1 Tax=Motiliproteus sediminis TaxID=1468178 RepID=UPI001AEFCE66|nr:phosphate-starvation-inducible PsiE family protein [Motiliproteus sediminis]
MFHEELPPEHADPLIGFLHRAIRSAVKVLAVLMVLVIFWSIADVVYVLYDRLSSPPFLLLDLDDILQTFGAFMAVLIAIEIFINIRLYLGSNVIPVQLVLATALMAVARKVIVLDLKLVSAEQIIGLALVTIALGVSYWLTFKQGGKLRSDPKKPLSADP